MTDRYQILIENIIARDTVSLILGLSALGFVGAYFLLGDKGRVVFLACMVLFWTGMLIRYGLMQ